MAVDNEESIYEEIITPSFAEQKRSCRNLSAFSRSISMDARINGHRPTQKILVESLNENLESNKKEIAQEEELYAVILGDEVECRNIDDLLNNDIKMDNKNEMHSSTLPSEKLVDIAQTDNSGASKDPDRNNQRKSSNNRPKLTRRPASFPKLLYERTEYAEILHTKPATEVSFNPCRPTRESDNPILRQEVIPSNNPSPVSASPAGSLRRTRNGDSTRSTSGDSGIQEDFHPTRVYENTNETRTTCNNRWSSTARDHCINRSSSEPEINVNFYENTHSSQNIEPQYENSFVDDTKRRHSDPASPMNSRKFIYQNIDNNGNEITPSLRSRTSSKPIDIKPISKTDKPRVLESPSNGLELTYSDLSFNETSIESFSSSPECGSSVSSDVSSNVSTIVSESVSPPPLPKARPSSLYMPRPRMSSFTSIYSTYSPLGPNHLKGLYVGCHNVHKTNPESIDRAVKEVALKANMLGLKTVSFEIINGLIKLGTVSPPLQLVSSFSLTDIHNVDRYSKDLRFLGFVVSKPGKEAVCHVIQSDQSEEILDAVKDAFKATSVELNRQKTSSLERNRGSFAVPTYSQPSVFDDVIKIGSNKIKKSCLVMTDSIAACLEKTSPKDYRYIRLNLQAFSVEVVNQSTGAQEESHSIPWILSLGLYNKDSRYFGYIVSHSSKGEKTKLRCYVYRCASVRAAQSILESIRAACQSSHSNPRERIYSYITPRMNSPMKRNLKDTISISSTHSSSSSSSEDGIDTTRIKPRLRSEPRRVPEVPERNAVDVNHVITLVPENEVLESTSEKDSNRTQCMQSSPNTGTSPEKDSPLTSSTPEFKDARVSPEKKSSIPCSSSPKFNNGVASPENHSTNLVSTTSLRKASDTANSTGKNSHNVRLTQSAPTPVSPVENNAENKTPNITKENKKSIKAKRKLLGGSLLKRKQKNAPLPSISVSLPNLDDLDTEECITPVLRREYSFTVSYLCSAVVNPPLKSKHVKECYKQYQKEMAKTKLPNNNGLLGNVLQLQIVTDEGVTMADLRNPNSFRREFPIETVDMFVAHPESEDCFAFSTKVDGTSKQKYHLFVKAKEPISEINEAFDLLHQTQISMGIALFS